MIDKTDLKDELRPEYDETLFKNGIRGKYAKQLDWDFSQLIGSWKK